MAYKPKYRKRSSFLSKLLTLSTVLFATLLVVGLALVLRDLLRSQQDQQAFRELAEMVQVQQTAPVPTATSPEEPTVAPTSPYQVLYDKNPDFVAWLTVPGTAIDYPVMHTPQDIEYYIYRSFDRSESPSGTPFVGDYGSLDRQKCIIYGHNMKDGTMFHDLLKYEKKAFWEENPTFTLHTLTEDRTYQIFSVVKTRVLATGESGFRFYRLEDGLESWLFDRSLYDTGINVTENDDILILSTCSYHTDEGRFLVAGKLLTE